MGLAFSESTNKTGMYELFQDLTNTNTTTYPVAKFTRDANNAYAQFKMLADRASKKWNSDDTNQTDYPIVKINLVSGQWEYPFTVDGSSTPNQITEVFRVECANSAGVYTELAPYDISEENSSIIQASSIYGTPYRYDKLANSIFLDPKPNYSYTNGLYLYVSRTPVYFLSSDTTKKPGIPDFFHEYLVYRPAYLYAITKLPALASGYLAFLQKMEHDIEVFYSQRDRDEKTRFTLSRSSNK